MEEEYYYDDYDNPYAGFDVSPQNPGGPIIGAGGILDIYSANNIFDVNGNLQLQPGENEGWIVTDDGLVDVNTGDIYSVEGEYLGNVNLGVTIGQIGSPAASGGNFLSNLLSGIGNALFGNAGTGTRSGTAGGGAGGGLGASSSFGGSSSGKSSSTAAGSGAPAAIGQRSTTTGNTYPINAAQLAAAQQAQTFGLILPLSLVAIVAIFALKKSS